MLPTKFRFIWPSGFRGEDFLEVGNHKQELPVVAMFVNGSGRNEHSLQKTFHRCFQLSFSSFGQAVSEQKIFRNRPKRNKNCLWRPCLLTNRAEMSNLYKGPTIDASYRVSVNLAMQFQRTRFFLELNHQKQELPMATMFVNGSGRNDQSLQRNFHICFLQSFGSFGHAVSEENIFYSFKTSISLC